MVTPVASVPLVVLHMLTLEPEYLEAPLDGYVVSWEVTNPGWDVSATFVGVGPAWP